MDKKPQSEPDPSLLLKHLQGLGPVIPQNPSKKPPVYTIQPIKKTLFAKRP